MNDDQIKKLFEEFVDLVMPELTPYETSLYLFFARRAFLKNDSSQIRVGFRNIGRGFGQGPKSKIPADRTIQNNLKSLEGKGCILIGDTNREGTNYTIRLPREIPFVADKIAAHQDNKTSIEDYYTDPEKRAEIYERDNYVCFYCGEKVTSQNATLDHYIPQSKRGTHSKENLKTACLSCNSIKSGKSYEEAAPLLLKRIQDMRNKKA